MASSPSFYNISAIRGLLLAAFGPEALRRLCQDEPLLRPVLNRFSPKHGLDEIVADLVDYCHDNQLWSPLLAAVRQVNPAQYAEFEPRLHEPNRDAGVVPCPLLDVCRAQVNSVLADVRHKYEPTLYVNRAIERDIDAFFDTPLAGPAPNCFAIVAPAGSGKTNLLCDMARRRAESQPVVLLMGGSLYLGTDTGLLGTIQSEIEAAGTQVRFHSAAECLHRLHRLAEELDRDALLIVDAINEHDSPEAMKKALGNLLRATRGKRVKLLVTCRDYYWGLFQADFWQAALVPRPPAQWDEAETEGAAEEDFAYFAAGEQERALTLYLDHYQITGRPLGEAAEQCRHPLLLRFFCEAYRGQDVGEVEDIRLRELFDRYWARKLASIAGLMARHRSPDGAWLGSAELAAAVGDYLLNVASYMLHHNVRAVPLADIGRAGGREEQPGDRRSYYGRIRDEFIILEEVERGQGQQRTCQVAFVYEEFMEYVMARSLLRDWERAGLNEGAILAAIEALTNKYESFAQILGVMVYLSLMVKEQRGLALWSLLLNKGNEWRGVVFETFRKLPEDQLDPGVFDVLVEMLTSGQEEIQTKVLDVLKVSRVGLKAPRPAMELVAGLAGGENVSLARRAVLVLRHAPSDLAIPVLCRLIQPGAGRSIRVNAATALGRLYDDRGEVEDGRTIAPLIAALSDTNWQVRQKAAEALGWTGGARAVEPLIATLGDRSAAVRQRAAESLGRLGELRAEELVIGTANAGELAEQSAVGRSERLEAARAIEPLIAALCDSEPAVRRTAAWALGKLRAMQAVEPLITALRDSHEEVAYRAAIALGKLGDAQAVEPLIAALRDSPGPVSHGTAPPAAELGRVEPYFLRDWCKADDAFPRYLADVPETVQRGAIDALEMLGDLVARPLIERLMDGDEEARQNAADTLQTLGGVAVSPLVATLHESDKEVRRAIVGALRTLGDVAVGRLLVMLDNRYEPARQDAALALGELGDARAVEPLVAATSDTDEEVRYRAAEALAKLGDARAVEPLIAALKGRLESMRVGAATALSTLGAAAVEPLIGALSDSDVTVRQCAARALAEIKDARAAGPLIGALSDPNEEVRYRAAEALGGLGDPQAIEPVIAALGRGGRWAQWSIAAALGDLGDARATEPLIAALEDRDETVRWAAALALRRIDTPAARVAVKKYDRRC